MYINRLTSHWTACHSLMVLTHAIHKMNAIHMGYVRQKLIRIATNLIYIYVYMFIGSVRFFLSIRKRKNYFSIRKCFNYEFIRLAANSKSLIAPIFLFYSFVCSFMRACVRSHLSNILICVRASFHLVLFSPF